MRAWSRSFFHDRGAQGLVAGEEKRGLILCCVCVWCRFHDWRVDVDGKILAQGAATDAEQDMAVTLVFAQHLVDRGKGLSRSRDHGMGTGSAGRDEGLMCVVVWWAGEWKSHKTPQGSTYGERAQTMIDAMWSTQMIQDGK